jgi:hypothetical protein
VHRKYIYAILFTGWRELLTTPSLFSLSGLNSMTSGIKIPHLNKMVHFTFYFFSTVLGSLSLKELKPNKILN